MHLKKITLILLIFISGITMAKASKTITFKYLLGETPIKLEKYSGDKKGLVYFHPHEDEKTSYETGKKIVNKYGGILYSLKQDGKRLIEFKLKGEKYLIDPNRMFTKEGIKKTLIKYGKSSQEAIDRTFDFAMWLSGVMSAPRVFAIHNNYNKGYNVKSYLTKDGMKTSDVSDIYINPKNSTGNFIYTTNKNLFSTAKLNGFNSVLQSPNVQDDGSYSVFAQKHNIDYINVESTRGDYKKNKQLIEFVNRFYNIQPIIKPK